MIYANSIITNQKNKINKKEIFWVLTQYRRPPETYCAEKFRRETNSK